MTSTPNAEPVPHAHTPAPAALQGEIVLARYRLGRRLGAGGMGVVYLARDEHLERDVAVKRIALEHDRDGRGEREAIAAARLSHPGIVALYEAGRDDAALYLVSELVRGRTLAQLLRDGELSDREVLRIGVTLCDALEHAHARGVIHRDVKPSNVICPDEPQEGGGVAKLTDFGIARMADGDVLTRTGDIMGTLAYMAPEQARGERLEGSADVYALGVVLYECLAGVNPVRAGNPAATARRVGMRLPALGRVRRDLPAGLCRAIDAAVLPEPAARTGLPVLRAALTAAAAEVSDVTGPIAAGEDPTGIAVRAQTAATRVRRSPAARRERRRLAPYPDVPDEVAYRRPDPLPPRRVRGRGRGEREQQPYDPAPAAAEPAGGRRLLARLAAAAGAAALAAGALAWLGPEPPLQAFAGAGAAGATVLLLPRLGWLVMVAVLLAWLAVAAPGIALLVAVAAVPVPFLLPRRGTAWSAPALAALLGTLSLAGAWPALAGQARRWPARAALGALGAWWLALAETLTSTQLVAGPGPGVLPRGSWEASALDAGRDAVWPLLSGGALALAAVWALAAVLLPLLVRGRSAALDLVGAAGWAATLAAATQAVSQSLLLPAPRGLVAGAVCAGAAAVAARAVRGRA
ncbi:MAG: eukaryotic-like serine/threonine-protein kinase [Solirubrobacteraceae bacterium]|nr:eukaryotic-like serine/threonine-protein kinase [Solirubrobacteraceae bacterium]